tara:strand:- start:24 stop:395 length:372 start_codon:yes stop_codon:yes gene_type:complete
MSNESENQEEDWTELWHYELWFRGKRGGSVFFSHRSVEPMLHIVGFAQKHGLLDVYNGVTALAYAACLTKDEEGYCDELNGFIHYGFRRDEDDWRKESCEENEIIDTEWDDRPEYIGTVIFES